MKIASLCWQNLRGFVRKDKILLLIATLILITVVTVSLGPQSDYSNLQTSVRSTSPGPAEQKDPTDKEQNLLTPGYSIEEVKDGIYTNYKYGFKFNYPESVFITFENHYPEKLDQESSLEAEFRDTDISSDRYPDYTLLVFVSEAPNNRMIFYKDYNRQIGIPEHTLAEEKEQKLLHNNKIIDKVLIRNNPAYISYNYIASYASDFEPSYGHDAGILKNNTLIRFSIFSSGKLDSLKEARLSILKNILNSIVFF